MQCETARTSPLIVGRFMVAERRYDQRRSEGNCARLRNDVNRSPGIFELKAGSSGDAIPELIERSQ